jgi:hypothetical protein
MHLYAEMQTRIIIENKLDEVYQSILRENDRVKNNALPDAKVDANSVDFGDARFMLPITRQVTIENVGLVRAIIRAGWCPFFTLFVLCLVFSRKITIKNVGLVCALPRNKVCTLWCHCFTWFVEF